MSEETDLPKHKEIIRELVDKHDFFVGTGNVKQSGYLMKTIITTLLHHIDTLESRIAAIEGPKAVASALASLPLPSKSAKKSVVGTKPISKSTSKKPIGKAPKLALVKPTPPPSHLLLEDQEPPKKK